MPKFKFLYINCLIGSLLFLSTNCSQKSPSSELLVSKEKFPLQEFVQRKDSNFSYELVFSKEEENYNYYVIKMVSQKWLDEKQVDEPIWWHWVSIVVPHEVRHQIGLMWIGGGSRDTALPEKVDPMLREAALFTQSITAQVHNIPFQPLTFVGDDFGERYEDALIAYGWRQFLEGGAKTQDETWLARFPMTKAVVSAMDVVSEFAAENGSWQVNQYVVAGASKRGWTTWTTAAVDDRVVAIVPIVIDLLNIESSFQHHWRNYGFWAPAVGDYVSEGIMDWQGSQEYQRLLELTEPYSFLDLYDMPKLLIHGSGDEFFLPDSWQFYWKDLIGEKHIRYVPNAGHGLRDSDAIQTMLAFYGSVLESEERPSYSWEVSKEGFDIAFQGSEKPQKMLLWQAHNEEKRDFRIDVLGPVWTATEIEIDDNDTYQVNLSSPDKGWTGYFLEMTYAGEMPFKVTTGVKVLPEEYPYPPFTSPQPKGSFVD
ncbi:PhoPQ-activated pathogenicity-related family protein [Pararhodonellum marinum]|uniref:PhoPQ-activated pathogenicity-related family protein n=1 Tax=Pararhodonellum marinum TaxID=2755358 RepID=UPI00188F0F91|nr:PhoPQ-activated pathogenicity-related family protein [Pararhodonellum marinum]